MGGTVLSLCDLTGNFVAPWVEAGYRAVLVDPQHGFTHEDGPVLKMARTVEEALPEIRHMLNDIVFVAAFPPCTDLAVSGGRWFPEKYTKDSLFQAKAGMVAEQCRTIGELSGAPYFVENPVSVLSSLFGPADHTFDPWHYTSLEPGDNYNKKTCLWAGNGFIMPSPCPDRTLEEPDNRIHEAPPGRDRANWRSKTPMGFARAVFAANHSMVDP